MQVKILTLAGQFNILSYMVILAKIDMYFCYPFVCKKKEKKRSKQTKTEGFYPRINKDINVLRDLVGTVKLKESIWLQGCLEGAHPPECSGRAPF